MNFLFIYVAMYTGGIETLILRMTDWLIKHDHSVDILLVRKDGELINKINSKANIFFLGEFPELSLLKILKNGFSDKYNVIYSFSPITTWMALLLRSKSNKNPIVFNGVYHLYDYKLYGNLYTKKVFDQNLPDRCKIFMTPLVKDEHEKIFNRKIANSIIWPLPIETSKFEKIDRRPKKFKIVSIGRLAGFKSYNIYMLDVVNKLLASNYDVKYYIYGDGSLGINVADKIKELGLSENVFMCGTIDYESIVNLLSDAFVFVGMGTSVIEAGFCKVPSLVAIAYAEKPITHGFIHELPNYNCGEMINNFPTYDLYEKIKAIFDGSQVKYESLCSEAFEALKSQYDIDFLMEKLLNEIIFIKNESVVFEKITTPYIFICFKTIVNAKRILIRLIKKLKNSLAHQPDN